MKQNECMKCEHMTKLYLGEEYSPPPPSYLKCGHPDIKVVSFDPVYGRQVKYPDCANARREPTQCLYGKLFEPKLSIFARLKRKLFS